jgi:Predicted membrane-associated Zn-dependent proteases 1
VDNAGELIASAPQQGFSVQIERDGQQKELHVQDAYQPVEKKNKIGIYYTPQIEPVGLGGSLRAGAVMTGRLSTEIFRAVGSLFTRPSEITSQMTGPIGTVSVMGDVLQEGFSSGDASGASAPTVDMRSGALSIMMLSIMLSVNLGVFNLLPLPALDGGRLVFTLIEMIARRPVPRNVQAAVNAVGLLLFLVLAVVLSVNDVGRLVVPGR